MFLREVLMQTLLSKLGTTTLILAFSMAYGALA